VVDSNSPGSWNALGSRIDLDYLSEVHQSERKKNWHSNEGYSEILYQSEVSRRCSSEGNLMNGNSTR
jgi:hypothetical protein